MTTTWNRKDVKAKGKTSFKDNFWKCVLTALILAIIGGGMSTVSPSDFSTHYDVSNHRIQLMSDEDRREIMHLGLIGEAEGDLDEEIADDDEDLNSLEQDLQSMTEELDEIEVPTAALVAFAVVFFVAFIAALAIGLTFNAFLINPIELGCKRFFRKNLEEPAKLNNLAFAFDSNYKNIVKTMFLRDIYVLLWILLFIIPGIVKAYEYKMIPYLLSENPGMTTEEAFAESKKLMTGNKWKAFVLDLSFILWDLLSLITCGIVGIFWVNPYKASTQAALYEAIKYGTASSETAVQAQV